MNEAPVMIWSPGIEVNSNTAPFPYCLLMESNVFIPLIVSFPGFTDINGALFAAKFALLVKLIPSRVSVPSDVTDIKVFFPVSILGILKVKLLSVSVPELWLIQLVAPFSFPITDALSLVQYGWIVSVDVEFNPG